MLIIIEDEQQCGCITMFSNYLCTFEFFQNNFLKGILIWFKIQTYSFQHLLIWNLKSLSPHPQAQLNHSFHSSNSEYILGWVEVKDDTVFHFGGGDPIILHCYLFEEADRLIKNEIVPSQISSDYLAILFSVGFIGSKTLLEVIRSWLPFPIHTKGRKKQSTNKKPIMKTYSSKPTG